MGKGLGIYWVCLRQSLSVFFAGIQSTFKRCGVNYVRSVGRLIRESGISLSLNVGSFRDIKIAKKDS
jgi:hypothetical protein